MKSARVLAVMGLIGCLAAPALQAAEVVGASCDRACLNGLMDQYLAALDVHDPARLPLARNAKFTANTVHLPLGDGFWQTIDTGSISTSRSTGRRRETGTACSSACA